MRKVLATLLSACVLSAGAAAQTGAPGAQRPQPAEDEEVVRITSQLVQTDVVVTDRNDRIVTDLKLNDFELYDNGKRQDLRFMEFVSVDSPTRRTEGVKPESLRAENDPALNPTARDVRRIVAFVVDDLTIPHADLVTVRQAISNFVENQMAEGDLVAIVRTVGGKGLLQQFTSDKALLRRAIAQLNIVTNPFAAFDQPDTGRVTTVPAPLGGGTGALEDMGSPDLSSPNDDTTRYSRGLIALGVADSVIDSLRGLPGRKSMVLFSSGIPIFEFGSTGNLYTSISTILQRVTDHAVRAGVVVNTVDPRGLKATPGVKGFKDTPARSALGGGDVPSGTTGTGIPSVDNPTEAAASFGRGGTPDFANMLSGGLEHMGLRVLSDATGGVTVVNRNDIDDGVQKVVARSRGYYVLAYSPSQPFDNKFHKLEVKVKRDGVRVYRHAGYLAREERRVAPKTKEEEIAAAARSPLSKRDIDVTATLGMRFAPAGRPADLGIALAIDPAKFEFKEEGGKYTTSYDVVGFIYDEVGKLRGGFSETVNASLTPEELQRARAAGLPYYAATQLPPGYYQLRLAVREAATGHIGSLSRYVEVPNVSKGRFAMSSLFLHAVNPATPAQPLPLLAGRVLTRRQEVRYSAIIYNARAEAGKPRVRSQLIISQGGKVLFREPEQEVELKGTDASQLVKVGQLALAKVQPGRYVLTLVVTDPLADKNNQTLTRSIDFTVTN
ncbi:MAG TPA: VWA domain-containing protein [Pyrinomonadaceae bacterium]